MKIHREKETAAPSRNTEPASKAITMGTKLISNASTVNQPAFNWDVESFFLRRWKIGDVYAPHDLSARAIAKYKKKKSRPGADVFDLLGINPLDEYKVR